MSSNLPLRVNREISILDGGIRKDMARTGRPINAQVPGQQRPGHNKQACINTEVRPDRDWPATCVDYLMAKPQVGRPWHSRLGTILCCSTTPDLARCRY